MNQLQEGPSLPLGPPGIRRQHFWKGLSEDTPPALEIVTKEFAGMNNQLNWPGTPGQVRDLALISTVDSGTPGSTLGAGYGCSPSFQVDDYPIAQPGYKTVSP